MVMDLQKEFRIYVSPCAIKAKYTLLISEKSNVVQIRRFTNSNWCVAPKNSDGEKFVKMF